MISVEDLKEFLDLDSPKDIHRELVKVSDFSSNRWVLAFSSLFFSVAIKARPEKATRPLSDFLEDTQCEKVCSLLFSDREKTASVPIHSLTAWASESKEAFAELGNHLVDLKLLLKALSAFTGSSEILYSPPQKSFDLFLPHLFRTEDTVAIIASANKSSVKSLGKPFVVDYTVSATGTHGSDPDILWDRYFVTPFGVKPV